MLHAAHGGAVGSGQGLRAASAPSLSATQQAAALADPGSGRAVALGEGVRCLRRYRERGMRGTGGETQRARSAVRRRVLTNARAAECKRPSPAGTVAVQPCCRRPLRNGSPFPNRGPEEIRGPECEFEQRERDQTEERGIRTEIRDWGEILQQQGRSSCRRNPARAQCASSARHDWPLRKSRGRCRVPEWPAQYRPRIDGLGSGAVDLRRAAPPAGRASAVRQTGSEDPLHG